MTTLPAYLYTFCVTFWRIFTIKYLYFRLGNLTNFKSIDGGVVQYIGEAGTAFTPGCSKGTCNCDDGRITCTKLNFKLDHILLSFTLYTLCPLAVIQLFYTSLLFEKSYWYLWSILGCIIYVNKYSSLLIVFHKNIHVINICKEMFP